MGEMDIYMRRRLVALGGLVAFFIFFVLVVKSCGGGDEENPLTPVNATGPEEVAPLTQEEFISQADAICQTANSAVGRLDPTATDATRSELQITRQEVAQLEALEVDSPGRQIREFMAFMNDVVDALAAKQAAIQAGDTVADGEAQTALDTAEAEARALGEEIGFRDCGQFLDAGEGPAGDGEAATGTEGGVVPTDPGAVPETGGEALPQDPTAPPDDTGEPPPDDTGGITP